MSGRRVQIDVMGGNAHETAWLANVITAWERQNLPKFIAAARSWDTLSRGIAWDT